MKLLKEKHNSDQEKELSLNDDNIRVKNKKNKFSINKNKINAIMNLDVKDIKNILISLIKKNTYFKKAEKKKNVVAFDIGSKSIKIAEGMYYKNTLNINKCIKVKTPKGAVKDGEIINKPILISYLKDVLVENSIKAKDGICTNNSSLIINREITIPKVEEEEIDTVVRFEIQQYLPINLEDYVLQVTVLGETLDNKLEVRVIAYPDKMAISYFDLLKELNIKPYVLDVNYNALNKLTNYIDEINFNKFDKEHTYVFIDMGAETLDVNLYNGGVLKFTRIIKAGGDYLDEIIKHTEDISSQKIEDFKINNINLRKDAGEYQNPNIVTEIDDWIDKIEKIIQFYKNKNKNDEVNKIYIYGGTSKIKGLSKHMTSKLGIDTERVKVIPKIPLKSSVSDIGIEEFINVAGSVIRI